MHTNFLVGERIGYFLGPCGSRLVRILYTRFLERVQQCWYILLCTCVRLYIVYYTRLSDVVGPVCVRNRPGVFGEDSAARGLIYFMYASVHTHTHTHTHTHLCIYVYVYTLHSPLVAYTRALCRLHRLSRQLSAREFSGVVRRQRCGRRGSRVVRVESVINTFDRLPLLSVSLSPSLTYSLSLSIHIYTSIPHYTAVYTTLPL